MRRGAYGLISGGSVGQRLCSPASPLETGARTFSRDCFGIPVGDAGQDLGLEAKMKVESLDHLVLTVKDIDATCRFYSDVLGMEVITFGVNRRKALSFGSQKINLHEADRGSTLVAAHPTPGSADVCFVTSTAIADVIAHLSSHGVKLIAGPIQRDGARGVMTSVYFRDPDLNLVEVSKY